jgi:hypothetical protein
MRYREQKTDVLLAMVAKTAAEYSKLLRTHSVNWAEVIASADYNCKVDVVTDDRLMHSSSRHITSTIRARAAFALLVRHDEKRILQYSEGDVIDYMGHEFRVSSESVRAEYGGDIVKYTRIASFACDSDNVGSCEESTIFKIF